MAALGVTNSSPDIYTEGLNVDVTTAPGTPFSTSGNIHNLAAGSSDNSSMQVSLDTGASGTFSDSATLGYVSTGEGTTGATDIGVGSGTVNLVGKVYAPAVAQVDTTTVDFGIVHVGDTVPTQGISVSNTATGALTDVLNGQFGSVDGPFTGQGDLTGLVAGATDTASLQVGLDTGMAGIFTGDATIQFISHDDDLSDLDLGSQLVNLFGQVNNYAEAAVAFDHGDGAFSGGGTTYLLDFGSILLGSTDPLEAFLFALNDVLGPADLLDGDFLAPVSSVFDFSDLDPFSDLSAGDHSNPFSVAFNPTGLGVGLYTDQLSLVDLVGHNTSGFSEDLADISISLRARVVGTPSVPEPGSLVLLLVGGLPLLIGRVRRRSAK